MDLYLYPSQDGGEIEILQNGDPRTTSAIYTSAYISLFSSPYWGNSISNAGARYLSQLNELFAQPLSNSTRLDVIEATKDALAWMIEAGLASRIEPIAEIASATRLNMKNTILEPSGESTEIAYSLNWTAQEVALR